MPVSPPFDIGPGDYRKPCQPVGFAGLSLAGRKRLEASSPGRLEKLHGSCRMGLAAYKTAYHITDEEIENEKKSRRPKRDERFLRNRPFAMKVAAISQIVLPEEVSK